MTRGDVVRGLIVLLVVGGVVAVAWPDRRNLSTWRTPQTVLSAAGLIVGFVIVSWQLKRQHWNTLDNNIRVAQDRLKVELYGKIAERIEVTARPLSGLAMAPTAFVGELVTRNSGSPDRTHVPPSRYFPQVNKAQEQLDDTVTDLMSILETYAIVAPEFAKFRARLAESLRHAHVAVNDFQEVAFQFAGGKDFGVVRWPPTDADSETLSALATSARSSVRSLKTVVSELCITAQNYHLGNLFTDNRLTVSTIPE